MVEMTRTLPVAHPLSAALITMLVEDLPIPSTESLDDLRQRLIFEVRRSGCPRAVARNVLVTIGAFAERYVDRSATVICALRRLCRYVSLCRAHLKEQ
jgi:hypothetical protein